MLAARQSLFKLTLTHFELLFLFPHKIDLGILDVRVQILIRILLFLVFIQSLIGRRSTEFTI